MESIYLILVAVSTVICGQLLLKSGMSNIGRIDRSQTKNLWALSKKIFRQKKVIIGFLLYGLSSVLWIYILSYNDLSFAYPFFSIAYVGVPTAAALILKEYIPLRQWVGIFIVVLGILLVATTS